MAAHLTSTECELLRLAGDLLERLAEVDEDPGPPAAARATVMTSPAAEPPQAEPALLRRLAFWRSPADQPAWARPALLVMAVVAGLAYGWQMGSSIEIYYAAAVRSMSMSWHDFVYAAFDPAGTVSVDKLPGAFWVQALSVRLFGVHAWAIGLPQVLEGVAHRPGPLPGRSPPGGTPRRHRRRRGAGGVPGDGHPRPRATSPTPCSCCSSCWRRTRWCALSSPDRRRSLVMAGVWVGLAFQAKMIEAWFVVPALGRHLPGGVAPDCAVGALLGLAAMVVGCRRRSRSVGWSSSRSAPRRSAPMSTGASTTPSSSRCSTTTASGGWANRHRTRSWAGHSTSRSSAAAELRAGVEPTAHRCLRPRRGMAAPDPSLMVVVAGLVVRRRKPRTDRVRAGFILWGTWLLVLGAVFSASQHHQRVLPGGAGAPRGRD